MAENTGIILQGRVGGSGAENVRALYEGATPFSSSQRRKFGEEQNLGTGKVEGVNTPHTFADKTLNDVTDVVVVHSKLVYDENNNLYQSETPTTFFREAAAVGIYPDEYIVYKGNEMPNNFTTDVPGATTVTMGKYRFPNKEITKNDLLQAIAAAVYIQSQTFLQPLPKDGGRLGSREKFEMPLPVGFDGEYFDGEDFAEKETVTTGTVNVFTDENNVKCEVARHRFANDNETQSVAERADTLRSDIVLGMRIKDFANATELADLKVQNQFDVFLPRAGTFLIPCREDAAKECLREFSVKLAKVKSYSFKMYNSIGTARLTDDERVVYEYAVRGMDTHGNVQFSGDRNGFTTTLSNEKVDVTTVQPGPPGIDIPISTNRAIKHLKWANGTELCAFVRSGEINFYSLSPTPTNTFTGLDIFSKSSYILSSEQSIDGTFYRQNLLMSADSYDKAKVGEFSRLSEIHANPQEKRKTRTVLSGNVELYLGFI